MRIEKVCLENVKSYGNGLTEISLAPGVNAILGENGAGKSTVLEAVGYALFDYLNPYTQEDFVRDGAESGRVRVGLLVDGEKFVVERSVGKSTYRVLGNGEEIASQKQNVIPWIRDRFGIPPALPLDVLWNTSIGVPQGQLTSDFVKPPKQRRQSFDPVLQTAGYADAWEEMREVEKVIETEISEVEKEMRGLEERASGVEDKVEEKGELEDSLEELEEILEGAKDRLEGLKSEKDILEGVKSELESLRLELDSKEDRIGTVEDSLRNAKDLVEEARSAREILDENERAHQEYEGKAEETEELAEEMEGKEELEKERFDLNTDLAELEERKKGLEEAVERAWAAKERMESLSEDVSKQGRIEGKISKLEAEVEGLEESITLLEEAEGAECPTCNQLLPRDQREGVLGDYRGRKAELEQKVSRLKEELSDLGSPKEEMERARTRYRDNKHAREELAEVEDRIEELEDRRKEIESQLEEYAGVEEKIEKLKRRLRVLEEAHERYVRNEELASKLEGRKKKASDLEERLKDLRERKEEVESELARKREQFDEERYQEVSSKVEELASDVSGLGARIEERRKRLEGLNKKIKEKREAQQKLEEERANREELEKDLEFAGFVRETIRHAQPLVTEMLIQKISEVADKIFRQLRGEARTLEWTRDYQIVVKEGGKEKAFHKLSGGEQVCAALAVRLAILRRFAPVDFAFLDEPTESLDETRKQNLADQLGGFGALDQLCVVSHDRVFESVTDRVVSLHNNGKTEVMSDG